MKRLAMFFVLAGLFALAACNLPDGPIVLGCTASNCPPPASCQVPNEEGMFDGIPVCMSSNDNTHGGFLPAPPQRSRSL